MLQLFILGFLLGIRHTFESDHLVAISTITSESSTLKTASKIGTAWGAGHTTTLLIVGFFLMTFHLIIPPHIALFFEKGIGILLVLLGFNLFLKIRREKIHLHQHTHNGTTHAHLHSHKTSKQHIHPHLKKSFLIGILHGLAGSAGLMLLMLGTVKNIPQGLAYTMIFGVGSMLGMTLISTLISVPFLATKKLNTPHQWIQIGAGMLSVIIGIGIIR